MERNLSQMEIQQVEQYKRLHPPAQRQRKEGEHNQENHKLERQGHDDYRRDEEQRQVEGLAEQSSEENRGTKTWGNQRAIDDSRKPKEREEEK